MNEMFQPGDRSFICPWRYQGCGMYMNGLCRQMDGDPQFWNCETYKEYRKFMHRDEQPALVAVRLGGI